MAREGSSRAAPIAFGFSAAASVLGRPSDRLGTCSLFAPSVRAGGCSVRWTEEEERREERESARKGQWQMITKRQRRMRKEAQRKRQEARDEAVFLEIDEIVEDLKEGNDAEIIPRMEVLNREENQLNEPMCNYLANNLAKLVRPPRGLKLVRIVLEEQARREIPYRTATFNTMIRCCALQKDYHQSKWWYERMEELGVRRDIGSYNQMMFAAANEKDADYCERVWKDMLMAEKKASATTFNSLIKVYDLMNDVRGVRGAYRRMKEGGVVPTWWTYDALIRVYGRNGEFDLVESVLKEMERNDSPPDARVFSRIILLCAEAGDKKAVRWWLSRMLEQRLHPSAEILSMMVEAHVIAENVEGAEEVITEMKKHGVDPGLKALNSLMLGYARLSDVAGAKSVLVRMHQLRIMPDVWTYNVLLSILGRANDVAGAELVFAGMLKKGMAPQLVTIKTLARLFSKNSLFGKVLSVFDEAERYQLPLDNVFFILVAQAMIETGKLKKASLLLRATNRSPDRVYSMTKVRELLIATVEQGKSPYSIIRCFLSLQLPFSQEALEAAFRYLQEHGMESTIPSLATALARIGLDIPEEMLTACGSASHSLYQSVQEQLAQIPESQRICLDQLVDDGEEEPVLYEEDGDDAEDSPQEGDENSTSDTTPMAARAGQELEYSPATFNDRRIESRYQRSAEEALSSTPEEDDEETEIAAEKQFRLYRCLLTALRGSTDNDMSKAKISTKLTGVDISPFDPSVVPERLRRMKPLTTPQDFQILPRKSEMYDDAGK